jgi:hypothetical protein
MMALLSAAVTHGYGLHVESIQNSYDREQALMYTFVAPTASILASTSGKMSMVLFLVRVLGQSTRKVHLWLLYSVTVIMIGANIFTMGVLLGGCTPMEKSWKPEISGSCVAPVVFKYVGRIQSGMITDIPGNPSAKYLVRVERFYGSYYCGISSVHGVETQPEAEHEVRSCVSYVWRSIVRDSWRHSPYLADCSQCCSSYVRQDMVYACFQPRN